MEKHTNIRIDGKSIVISPDLTGIFNFIMNIDEEVKNFLSFCDKLKDIGEQYLELMDFAKRQAEMLNKHSIKCDFQFKEDPSSIANKLTLIPPLRSQMIVLFAYLETLRVLWTAYDIGTDDEQQLRNASDDAIDSFIETFCLSKENSWYKNNSKRGGKIGKKDLRYLRNSLTHSFSLSKSNLALVGSFDEKADDLRKKTNNIFQAISPMDLYEICVSAFLLILEKWNDDCRSDEFQKKIEHVKKLIKVKAPIEIHNNTSPN